VTPDRLRLLFLVLPLTALIAMSPAAVHAGGGGGFDEQSDDDDSRSTVFGFVKDRDGNAVGDVKVTITMEKLNTDFVLHSDADGHYTGKLFYKVVNPEDIDVACAKDGYHQTARTRKPPLATGAPIEMDCVLDH
jgi:hypothetical protein